MPEDSKRTTAFGELGITGLKHNNGIIAEEFLRELKGRRGAQIIRQMVDNDSVIGSIMLSVETGLRAVEWTIEPWDDTPQRAEEAEFVEECMKDMSHSWPDFIAEALSKVPYGWSFFEVIYKKREGPQGAARSKFSDGKIGWRKMAQRSQDTLDRWDIDDAGGITGLWQRSDRLGTPSVFIPIEKAVLFRTSIRKNNPEGRALAVDTPIPTPDGWRMMGDLAQGDLVYNERGAPTEVVAVAEWENRPRYRVTFRDGTSIVADGRHEWECWSNHDRQHRNAPKIRETSRMAERRLQHGYSIQRTAPLWRPEQAVLIDPYVLGTWLGDGDSNGPRISCHVDDVWEQAAEIERCGYSVGKVDQNGRDGGHGRTFRIEGLARQLTTLGLRGNKHIPDGYLNGSENQRLALLRGLMDTDGTVDSWGRCQFTQAAARSDLVLGVAELARSLGMVVSLRVKPPGPKRPQPTHIASFTPQPGDLVPFRLWRKAQRVTDHQKDRAARSHGRWNWVQSIEPMEDGLTRCIEVASPSHLFLAGEAMVPTHNSLLRTAYSSWYRKDRIETGEMIGVDRDLVGLPMVELPAYFFGDGATDSQKAVVAEWKRIVTQIRSGEQAGIVALRYLDDDGEVDWSFQLISSPGEKTYDTTKIIERLTRHIAISTLQDIVLLGHEHAGSLALADTKKAQAQHALKSQLDEIAASMNSHVLPRLFRLNGMSEEELPQLVPGEIGERQMEQISNLIVSTSNAGMSWFPSSDGSTENQIRTWAGFDPVDPTDDDGSLMETTPPDPEQPAETEGGNDDPDLDAE